MATGDYPPIPAPNKLTSDDGVLFNYSSHYSQNNSYVSSIPDLEELKKKWNEAMKSFGATAVGADVRCGVCGKERPGGMSFDDGKVHVCLECLVRLMLWAGRQSMSEPKTLDRVIHSNEKRACARCERKFPMHCLWLMGKDNNLYLCDPCREQSLEEVIEKSKPPRRLLL